MKVLMGLHRKFQKTILSMKKFTVSVILKNRFQTCCLFLPFSFSSVLLLCPSPAPLPTCSLFFNLKYAKYLEGYSTDGVRHIYKKACTTHLPRKPAIHLFWAAFEEQQGRQRSNKLPWVDIKCWWAWGKLLLIELYVYRHSTNKVESYWLCHASFSRQGRWGSGNPEVPGGDNPRPGHGASSEGQSWASPRQLGWSGSPAKGSHGVWKGCHWDVVLRCEVGQAVHEGAEKSEQGQEGAAGCHWQRPGEISGYVD